MSQIKPNTYGRVSKGQGQPEWFGIKVMSCNVCKEGKINRMKMTPWSTTGSNVYGKTHLDYLYNRVPEHKIRYESTCTNCRNTTRRHDTPPDLVKKNRNKRRKIGEPTMRAGDVCCNQYENNIYA